MPNALPTLYLRTKMSGENQAVRARSGQVAQRPRLATDSICTRHLHQGPGLQFISVPVPLFTRGRHEASDSSEVSAKWGGDKCQLT